MTKIEYSEIPDYSEKGKKQIKIPQSKIESLKNGVISEVWIGNEGVELYEIPNYSEEEVTYNIEDFIDTKKSVEKVEEQKKEPEYTGITYEEAKKIAMKNGTSIFEEIYSERIVIEPEKLSQKSKEKWEKYFLNIRLKNKEVALEGKLFVVKQLRELMPEKYKHEYDVTMEKLQAKKQKASAQEQEKKNEEEKNLNTEVTVELYTVTRKSDGAVLLTNGSVDELVKLLGSKELKLEDYLYDTKKVPLKEYLETKSKEKEEIKETETTKAYTVTRKENDEVIFSDLTPEEFSEMFKNGTINIKNVNEYQVEKKDIPVEQNMETKTEEKETEKITAYTVTRKSDGEVIYNNLTPEEYSQLFKDGTINIQNVNDYKIDKKDISKEEYLETKSENKNNQQKTEQKAETVTVTGKENLSTSELSEKIYQKDTLEKIKRINDPSLDITQIFVGGIVTIEERGLTKDEFCKAIKLIPKKKEYITYLLDKKQEGKTIEEYAENSKIDLKKYEIMIETEYWINATNNPSIIGIETKEEYYKRCFPEAKQR